MASSTIDLDEPKSYNLTHSRFSRRPGRTGKRRAGSSAAGGTLALVFLLGAASTAWAASETFTTGVSNNNVGFTESLSLEGFNTNLGTLTAVELNLDLNTSSAVEIFDPSAMSESFSNASTESTVNLSGPDDLTLISQSFGAIVATGTAKPGLTTEPATLGTYDISVTPTNLAAYEVNGIQNLNFTISDPNETLGGTSPQNDLFFSGRDNLNGTVDIQYVYSVPEPSTWAMMLIGLGAVGFCVRRKASLL